MAKVRTIKPRFWLFMMSALLAVFFCLYLSQGRFLKGQDLRILELQARYTEKVSENEQLKRRIEFSKTDEYVRRVAHEDLGLLKNDEIRFVAAVDTRYAP
ncbi:MAG: septum formation initiator family protein [Candidatus Excrementavichristensenella sp.]|nr:septum formation initiator family protein [Bacillota bacterium]NLL54069.1 hypothetical protein [Clostridiales bacterium]